MNQGRINNSWGCEISSQPEALERRERFPGRGRGSINVKQNRQLLAKFWKNFVHIANKLIDSRPVCHFADIVWNCVKIHSRLRSSNKNMCGPQHTGMLQHGDWNFTVQKLLKTILKYSKLIYWLFPNCFSKLLQIRLVCLNFGIQIALALERKRNWLIDLWLFFLLKASYHSRNFSWKTLAPWTPQRLCMRKQLCTLMFDAKCAIKI